MNADILLNPKDPNLWSWPVAACTIDLPIGGITPFTTIDFPGRLAAVLYTQGCAWRCRYCHNAHLWRFDRGSTVPFGKVLHFLENRKRLLDGVVFCGGEPTAHEGLLAAMQTVKAMGFQVALHTTGMHPERLKAILPLCDWVGMDIKAPFAAYSRVTQIPQSGENASLSVEWVLKSGVEYEFRTTFHPALLSEEDVLEIARMLRAKGAKHFVLQLFKPQGCVDSELKERSVSVDAISGELKNKLTSLFESFQIRG